MKQLQEFKNLLREILLDQIVISGKAQGLNNVQEIQVVERGGKILIEGPEKYKWVQLGRKKGSGKGSRVPIEALVAWIKKKNITPSSGMSTNQLAWAIQTSIYKFGIKNAVKPRPFIEEAFNNLEKSFPELFQAIIKEYFPEQKF